MGLFDVEKKPGSFDIIREGEDVILYVYCKDCPYTPSIEDDEECMAKTIEKLTEVSGVTKIIFEETRDYEYDEKQTKMLSEIAGILKIISRQKEFFSYKNIVLKGNCGKYLHKEFVELQSKLLPLIKKDPIGAFVEIRRAIRRERIAIDKTMDKKQVECINNYIRVLNYLVQLLEKTEIIKKAAPYFAGYKVGDRAVYREIFFPTIKPDFMYTKLMSNYPANGEEIDNYTIDENTEITIFKLTDSVKTVYHMVPPEFKLSEDKYELLDLARKIMAEHKPKEEDFTKPERIRDIFYNVGKDLLDELAESKNIKLSQKELDELTKILIRYTVGFGLIEVLLSDEKIQDISINSPMGKPIFIVHADYGDCTTNIIPTKSEAESWASKLRMISGRPLDEADPILDTELRLSKVNARVAVITKPLNPTGIAYSFRRHRNKPWTLPLFIKYKMVSPVAAGLISFLVDGTRSMLIAGTRSAGKSSLLSSILVEIMRRYRIITIEDTLELPVSQLRNLGYNIQSMKVASALSKKTTEVSAEDGIRTTLRLGDSALIVGEVRSTEAKALYEAMRVGAAANVVAGTIHGDSPYGVYDRVVNDIGIPKTSFKATDIVIVANPVKSADGLHRFRRVTQITEIRKHWTEDPLEEKGFGDLMKYDAKKDELVPTDEIINGESDVLKMIAANIREFSGNWDAVWNNILLRAKIKKALVDYAEKANDLDMLEAEFAIKANDIFHIISDEVKEDVGWLDNDRIFSEWESWLKREIKKRRTRI